MRMIRPQLLELSGYFCLVFFFSLFNLYLTAQLSYTTGELVIDADQPGNFQIYWRKSKKLYEEKKSIIFKTNPDQPDYSFKAPSFAKFDWLRIDPVDDKNRIQLRKLSLHHKIFPSVTLFPLNRDVKLGSVNQLEVIERDDIEGIYLISTGNDPHFEINVSSLLMDVIVRILLSLIFLSFVGAILIYFLLNQALLKGRQSTATVVMTVPDIVADFSKERLLEKINKICPGTQLISSHRQPGRDKYVFNFPDIADSTLILLIKDLKKISHLIQYRVHYNRSGEV